VSDPEHILCVPVDAIRKKIREVATIPMTQWNRGIVRNRMLNQAILGASEAEWLPRTQELERDETRKQIVVIAAIVKGTRVLAYPRAGEETRLHKKWSILIGGHVSRQDGNRGTFPVPGLNQVQTILRAMGRELDEEVGLTTAEPNVDFSGSLMLLNDDSDAVGRVHLGVLQVIKVPPVWEPHPMSEFGDAVYQWASREDLGLLHRQDQLESWSVIAATHLADEMVRRDVAT
jgi:predicted NUDIX family phosphoesterase